MAVRASSLSFHVKVVSVTHSSFLGSSGFKSLRHNTTQARPASPAFVCVTDGCPPHTHVFTPCPAGSAWENARSHWIHFMHLTLRGSPVLVQLMSDVSRRQPIKLADG